MVTTAYPQSTFADETSNLEMYWTPEEGNLPSHWSITPQMGRLKPVWLESPRDQISESRRTVLKVHSTRLLHALCWFLVFVLFLL